MTRGPREPVTSQARRCRIPLRLWLVSGDALGERDGTTIGGDKHESNSCSAINRNAVYILSIAQCAGRAKRSESHRYSRAIMSTGIVRRAMACLRDEPSSIA